MVRNGIIGSVIFIFTSIMLVNQAFGQDTVTRKLIPKLEYAAYTGRLIAHHADMKHLSQQPYVGNELRLGFQTTGSQYWQQLLKYPTFGVGLYSGYFNNKIVGNPMALFGFMEMPFKRFGHAALSTSWSAGCTFNINEYDSITNPLNNAIGTDLNVYIDFSLLYKQQFKNNWEWGGGIKFQHFSNGAIKYPNYGLNMVTLQATLSFMMGKPFAGFQTGSPEPIVKKYEIYVFEGVGWCGKNMAEPNVKYFNNSLSLGYNYRINQKRMIGFGADVFYNEENSENFVGREMSTQDYVSYAGFLSTDLLANKFRMSVQLGFYLYKPVDYWLPFYERVALRYYFVPWAFANVSLKAHAAKAQYVEYGIGWVF
ncbi:MAG: acyloxyacyl hydrolase [Salinivirgaceae bacterium]|nr:acyloxyacyl hydrolase [Salinivirgaceae bacterium]